MAHYKPEVGNSGSVWHGSSSGSSGSFCGETLPNTLEGGAIFWWTVEESEPQKMTPPEKHLRRSPAKQALIPICQIKASIYKFGHKQAN